MSHREKMWLGAACFAVGLLMLLGEKKKPVGVGYYQTGDNQGRPFISGYISN